MTNGSWSRGRATAVPYIMPYLRTAATFNLRIPTCIWAASPLRNSMVFEALHLSPARVLASAETPHNQPWAVRPSP